MVVGLIAIYSCGSPVLSSRVDQHLNVQSAIELMENGNLRRPIHDTKIPGTKLSDQSKATFSH